MITTLDDLALVREKTDSPRCQNDDSYDDNNTYKPMCSRKRLRPLDDRALVRIRVGSWWSVERSETMEWLLLVV